MNLKMACNRMSKRWNIDKGTGVIKVVYAYRFISWFLTSFFYLIGEPKSPFLFKMGVIFSLLVEAKLVTDIYIKHSNIYSTLKPIIIIEIIGITVLLLPTGGIKSPFVWYALNPVLVAATFLTPMFCWANLLFYTICAGAMSFIFFNGEHYSAGQLFIENSNIILILILITTAVEMLSELTKQLNNQAIELEKQKLELCGINKLLKDAKQRADESLKNVMSLYQAVETFTSMNNLKDFLQTFTDYSAKLTKADFTFFYKVSYGDDKAFAITNNSKEMQNICINDLEVLSREYSCISEPGLVKFIEKDFFIAPVKSVSRFYGLMGISVNEINYEGLKYEYFQKLVFLSGLSSVILERFHLENITANMMLVEEQNRIANEMHDNVSQRMFGISCAVHTLNTRWKNMEDKQIQEQMVLIREASNAALKELRAAIYKLSSKKRGDKYFASSVQKYLDEFLRLNDIIIDFKTTGDPEELPGTVKRALYRIIHEASGNAVRHGKCSKLDISLFIENDGVRLILRDDGIGFNFDREKKNHSDGLGLYNMDNIVKSLNGKFLVKSDLKSGTEIYVTIPKKQ